MKMKEKRTEEVVEEVVETNNVLDNYLDFHRYCVHQYEHFLILAKVIYRPDTCKFDECMKLLGLDISKTVTIETGFSKESLFDEFCKFIKNWIDEYNNINLSKIDNYTRYIIEMDLPNPVDIIEAKRNFKKCAQHTTEK